MAEKSPRFRLEERAFGAVVIDRSGVLFDRLPTEFEMAMWQELQEQRARLAAAEAKLMVVAGL